MLSNIDKEKTKKTIALVLENIRTEADARLLEEYYRLFKKEVSLFRRSAAVAYLLMLCDQGKSLRTARGDFSKTDKISRKAGGGRRSGGESRITEPSARRTQASEGSPSGTAPANARPAGGSTPAGHGDTQRYPLAEDESRWLFFSVGRSRRVFPREILGLINTKTAIPKEDIGAIRILDNYSFVQVRDTVAEQIIEALNGINFRGRPLTVNYAKSRKDGEIENDTDDGEETWNTAACPDEYAKGETANNLQDIDSPDDSCMDSEQRQDYTEEENI